MKVKHAKPGQVIEMLDRGGTVASGRFYRIAKHGHTQHAIVAWKAFNQGKINLFPDALCRPAVVPGFADTWKILNLQLCSQSTLQGPVTQKAY